MELILVHLVNIVDIADWIVLIVEAQILKMANVNIVQHQIVNLIKIVNLIYIMIGKKE